MKKWHAKEMSGMQLFRLLASPGEVNKDTLSTRDLGWMLRPPEQYDPFTERTTRPDAQRVPDEEVVTTAEDSAIWTT